MSSPTASRRPVRRTLAAAALALTMATGTVASFGSVAGAAPLTKEQEAAQLQDQIEATDLEISAVAEKLAAAESRRDAAQAEVLEAEARIQEAKVEVARIRELVEQNLASLYRRSVAGTSGVFDLGDANDLLRRGKYAKAQADRDDKLLQELSRAQDDLSIRRDDAQRARDTASVEREAIATTKAAYEAVRAAQQALLDKVKGEIAAAVAAERARREAATRAKFATSVNYPDVGPPNGSAAQAIAFARGVIGSPYSTNPRTGPSYDCSGLTKSAWGAAGVTIGNSSSDQYRRNVPIPLAAVQPGDLIFWGPGGSSHVALYVGGGQIIDASSSQNAVVQRPIWGSPSGAARVV
jgi:peptidoglycan DL-endopeptidase CwlO